MNSPVRITQIPMTSLSGRTSVDGQGKNALGGRAWVKGFRGDIERCSTEGQAEVEMAAQEATANSTGRVFGIAAYTWRHLSHR